MSLVVAVFVPTGIVLAADSRTTIQSTQSKQVESGTETVHTPLVLSDSAHYVLPLPSSGIGILTYGEPFANDLPVESHLKRFAEQFDQPGAGTEKIAQLLHDYSRSEMNGCRVLFIVAGFEEINGHLVQHVYAVDPVATEMATRSNVDAEGRLQFGVLRGGDTAVVDRLITPDCLPPFHLMPLADAVDYSRFLIDTTIQSLRFEPRFPNVGGPVDILTLTPEAMRFEQRKGQTTPENIRLTTRSAMYS